MGVGGGVLGGVLVPGMALLGLAVASAQNYPGQAYPGAPGQPPPGVPAPGVPPILMQQAQPDPRQFCYFNGQPYSLGSPYPGNTPGANGRPMRCQATPGMVNGYVMMQWSDEN